MRRSGLYGGPCARSRGRMPPAVSARPLEICAVPAGHSTGSAANVSNALLAAGAKGKRYALPNSRVMMHQPTGGATGQTSDISIAAREILRWRERMNELIASHTNKTAEEIASDSDRDFYLTAQDALAYGIVDKVIEAKPID